MQPTKQKDGDYFVDVGVLYLHPLLRTIVAGLNICKE